MHEDPVSETADHPTSAAAKLFDIRVMIGGLFVLYGVLLTGYGFFTSEAELQKAAGININLWLGLGMLVLGALFLLWVKLSPLRHDDLRHDDLRHDDLRHDDLRHDDLR